MTKSNTMFILYCAELRKIVSKKSVWIATVLAVFLILTVGLTNLSADGKLAYVNHQKDTLGAISGQKIDDAFLEKFHTLVKQELEEHADLYVGDYNADYMKAATNIGMKALYDCLYNTLRDQSKIPGLSAEQFYEAMRNDIEKDSQELGCTRAETDFWLSNFDRIEKPISYTYALAYQNTIDGLFLIGWMQVLILAIALAGVFADEKTCRTDALVLSTKNGRLPICFVKIAAGITFAMIETVILLGGGIGIELLLDGTTGWNGAIQNVIPSSAWNITIGAMITIYVLLAILAGAFFAVTNMILSHLTKSAIATMAIHASIIFVGLFNIPKKLGLLARVWELRPTMVLYYGTFCNTYLYGKLNCVQLATILYLGLTLLLAVILVLSYKKSQVESR